MSIVSATLGGIRLARGIAFGGRRRHQAIARLNAAAHARRWRQHVRNIKSENPLRPVFAIGLAEHLGDIVAAEPIVRHLRLHNPNAWIVWVTGPAYAELVQSFSAVDDVLTVQCLTEWIRANAETIFDQTVDLHLEGRYCPVCYHPYQRRTGNRAINVRNYYDHGCLLDAFCSAAGLPALHDSPRLNIPKQISRGINALSLPDEFVVVHCRSNQAERDWTVGKWRALARRITHETALPVVEIGAGRPTLHSQGVIQLCGKLSMLESAEVIRRARLFVGIDSGPAHLAHAVGTPGVILLGHYRAFKRYIPYSGVYGDGALATLLHADGPAATLTVDEVFAAIHERVDAERSECAALC